LSCTTSPLTDVAFCEKMDIQMATQTTENVFDNEQYLTITELAKLLNVSTQTLRRWEKEGKIKSYRLATTDRRRYKKSEVAHLIQPQI
jgi:excisionase family DNA binding protein